MKRLILILTLLLTLSLACARGGTFPASTPTTTAPATETVPTQDAGLLPDIEESVRVRLDPSLADVTYCTVDGVELKMDVYFPAESSQPLPALVYVHGGGWSTGDKNSGVGLQELPGLLESGFVVFSLNYRLAPEYQFPAMIEDVKCAIRSIRAHADEYHIDPNRIGVWGGSAGGHLVSLLGASDASAGYDVGEYLDYSSRVQAVVDMFGPVDLTLQFANAQTRNASQVFSADQLEAASPVTYISADDPPFLILQGDQDPVVPPEQSQIFYDRLTSANVPATLVMVRNAGHSFKPTGGRIDPSRIQLSQMIVDFFVENLK